MALSAPRSVLIVKLAAIGDVVMALPMVTALRAQDAATRITWLCGKTVAPLIEVVDGIDECVVVDDVAVLSGNQAQKAQAVMMGWSALRGRRFDLVITAHSDPRYRMLAARVRAGERRWFGERGARPRHVPGRYYGDEYVRLVTEVDDGNATRCEPPQVRVTLDAEVETRIAALDGRRMIALAPGGARNPARDNPLRRWPLEHYAALARRLVAEGYAVLLTGSADDAWIRPAFAGIDVVDLIEATSLPGLAALYARCAAVVTHDSGTAAPRAPGRCARRRALRPDPACDPPARIDARNRAVARRRAAVRALLRRTLLRCVHVQPLPADAAPRYGRGQRRHADRALSHCRCASPWSTTGSKPGAAARPCSRSCCSRFPAPTCTRSSTS